MTTTRAGLAPEAAAPDAGVLAEVVARASNPGFGRWMDQVERTGGCARPIRLAGTVQVVDTRTGEMRQLYTSDDEPDGALLTACNNRRETVCPSCAHTYRYDTYHLVAAGLRGGKGVPDTVAGHPRVFVTLTAPSFGPVHGLRDPDRKGRPGICRRPGRKLKLCRHGRPTWCGQRHRDGDQLLGMPLCPDCHDYTGAVLFNALVPELWRRFTITLRRELAKAAGVSQSRLREIVRPTYVKVGEYQRRGVIHLHAPIRLDAAGDDIESPPPAFTVDVLDRAVHAAAHHVTVTTPDLGNHGPARVLRFGDKVDVQPVLAFGAGEQLSAEAVAAYIGKYVTKTLDAPGFPDRRLTLADLGRLTCSDHYARMIRTTWALGGLRQLAHLKLRKWAHMLGFGGHVCTKSRRYSTTMTALRRARVDYRRQRSSSVLDRCTAEHDEETTVVLAHWSYVATGHLTTGDAWLAASAAARARERRETARLELRTA